MIIFGEPSEHKPDAGEADEGDGGSVEVFVVLGEAADWLDQSPFRVRQIARVTQSVAIRSVSMFWFPHRAHPSEMFRVLDNESQLIHPNHQLLESALR